MSHTNTTANFGLPQFITTDKPAWLTDVNVAYNAIDTAMKNNQDAASAAQGDATQALSDAAAAGSTASTAASAASGSVSSIANTFSESSTYAVGDRVMYNNLLYKCLANVDVPGPWTGPTNWVRTTIDAAIAGLTGSDIEYSSGVSVTEELSGKADSSDTYTKDEVNTMLSNSVYPKGTLAANADCNTITTNGIYRANGSTTNFPTGWGTLIVFSPITSQVGCVQVFITSGNAAYYRMCWDGATWQSWKQF